MSCPIRLYKRPVGLTNIKIIMWIKIPVKTSNDPNEKNDLNVNTAIYQAFKLVSFYRDSNLESKSADAKSKACRRKLKALQQVITLWDLTLVG